MNILLKLSYDGTAYHGWQIQKNAVSVCGTITRAIEAVTGECVNLIGCGRTDAGVHAKVYAANFHSNCRIPLERLPIALNSRLPRDISVHKAIEVAQDFHSTFSCKKKEYSYLLTANRDPFLVNRAMLYPYALDLEKMRHIASCFVGEHDFACVQSAGTKIKSTVRTLHYFNICIEGGLIVFKMCANGFLYNMARALVGSVLYGNEGKLDNIPSLIASGSRSNAGPTVPPYGLYMTNIWYGEGVDI